MLGGNILDLYSDYLLISTRKTTATGLSELADEQSAMIKSPGFLPGKN
jgi:hypothetical protein